MRSTAFGGFSSRSTVAPVTLGLIVTLVLCFLINWVAMPEQPLFRAFALYAADVLSKPWTLLTHPFAISGGQVFGVAFSCLWLWMIGTQVERDLGSTKYLAAFFAFSILGAILIAATASMMNLGYVLAGTSIGLGAITMLWGARNRSATIMFFGIIPMTATILCIITAVFTLLNLGMGAPLIGIVAMIPLALAWLWADNKLPLAYAGGPKNIAGTKISAAEKKREEQRHKDYMREVKEREIERKERERLKDLFERSLIDDPDEGKKEG